MSPATPLPMLSVGQTLGSLTHRSLSAPSENQFSDAQIKTAL